MPRACSLTVLCPAKSTISSPNRRMSAHGSTPTSATEGECPTVSPSEWNRSSGRRRRGRRADALMPVNKITLAEGRFPTPTPPPPPPRCHPCGWQGSPTNLQGISHMRSLIVEQVLSPLLPGGPHFSAISSGADAEFLVKDDHHYEPNPPPRLFQAGRGLIIALNRLLR